MGFSGCAAIVRRDVPAWLPRYGIAAACTAIVAISVREMAMWVLLPGSGAFERTVWVIMPLASKASSQEDIVWGGPDTGR